MSERLWPFCGHGHGGTGLVRRRLGHAIPDPFPLVPLLPRLLTVQLTLDIPQGTEGRESSLDIPGSVNRNKGSPLDIYTPPKRVLPMTPTAGQRASLRERPPETAGESPGEPSEMMQRGWERGGTGSLDQVLGPVSAAQGGKHTDGTHDGHAMYNLLDIAEANRNRPSPISCKPVFKSHHQQ